MAEWENCIGESDEWYTPPEIFKALNLVFDLDPFSPGPGHWVPAKNVYTKEQDGFSSPWFGTVFVNPPFGGRNGHVPALKKYIQHGDGIAVARAYTSAKWFQDIVPQVDLFLFPKGKTKFIRPDGTVGKAPGSGVIFLAIGQRSSEALKNSGLGMVCKTI